MTSSTARRSHRHPFRRGCVLAEGAQHTVRLSSISWYSSSASESSTIAPPAPTAIRPPCTTALRITTLRSAAPARSKNPMAPE
jgi:hypothetical protein